MLECALAAGICSTGAQVVLLGVIPTPAVAYLVREYGADAGVVISASHNPFEYNGIKFFNGEGYKLSDSVEEKIEELILDTEGWGIELPIGGDIGHCTRAEHAADDYIKFATGAIDCKRRAAPFSGLLEQALTPQSRRVLFSELGAYVECLSVEPDGVNINKDCGSTHIDKLEKQIAESGKFDVGIAFDGDADRMLAVDETGKRLTGDEIMLIVGKYLKENGKLAKDTITATVMSNLGFFLAAEKLGIKTAQTAVGDQYVLEEMLKSGYVLGGEESGHIIFLDHNSTGDGLLSALLLLEVIKKDRQAAFRAA